MKKGIKTNVFSQVCYLRMETMGFIIIKNNGIANCNAKILKLCTLKACCAACMGVSSLTFAKITVCQVTRYNHRPNLAWIRQLN